MAKLRKKRTLNVSKVESNKQTLNAIHEETEKILLQNHNNDIHILDKIKKLNLQKKNSSITKKERWKIENELESLNKKLNNKNEIYEFYANTIPVISIYNNISSSNNLSNSQIKNNSNNKSNITKFITIKNNDSEHKKSELSDEYSSIINKNHVKKIEYTHPLDTCNNCSSKNINSNSGSLSCIDCGLNIEEIISEDYEPTYKELQDIDIIPYYGYKKMNHFNDWLNSVQGKENSIIPEEHITLIKKALKKQKITDYTTVEYPMLRNILKKLNFVNYYEHSSLIINKLNNNNGKAKVLSLNSEQEEKLRNLFILIQEPCIKYLPESRINFLSYSYVIRKLCLLLEYDDVLKYLPILKNPEKLQLQNKIWRKICNELRWEYHPDNYN